MKRSVIFLSMHAPSFRIPQAGQKLAYGRLKQLAGSHAIHLVFFYNAREKSLLDWEDYDFCKSVLAVEMTPLRKISYLLTSFHKPFSIAMRSDRSVVRHVRNLLNVGDVGSIHVEYEQGGEFLNLIDARGMETTVVLHDVISQSVERFWQRAPKLSPMKWFYALQLSLIRHWEAKTLSRIGRLVVLNTKDRDFLQNNVKPLAASKTHIEVDYPQVSSAFHAARRDRREPCTLLFWGAMSRKENEDAVLWFAHSILPHVREALPDVKVIVLGAHPSEAVKHLQSPAFIVTGFVDDPIPYFEQATLAIAPLRYGAGIKLKVLESFAAGLPVVGTSVAAEGVDTTAGHLVVADDEVSFCRAVIAMISPSSSNGVV